MLPSMNAWCRLGIRSEQTTSKSTRIWPANTGMTTLIFTARPKASECFSTRPGFFVTNQKTAGTPRGTTAFQIRAPPPHAWLRAGRIRCACHGAESSTRAEFLHHILRDFLSRGKRRDVQRLGHPNGNVKRTLGRKWHAWKMGDHEFFPRVVLQRLYYIAV